MILNQSPEYAKNIEKLEGEGYRIETPQFLRGFAGGETFLVNDKGAIKSVHQGSGEIKDVPRPTICPMPMPQP